MLEHNSINIKSKQWEDKIISFLRTKKGVVQPLFLFLLVSTTIFFSTYKFIESPPVWYDEGIYLQSALNVSEFGNQGIQVEPGVFTSPSNSTVGFPLIYPVGASFTFFEAGIVQARSVMVLFILLFVATSYFLIKSLCGFRVAAMSSLLLATFPVLYGNGKSVLGEVPGMFFLSLFLLLIWKLERNDFRGYGHYISSGLVGGLCIVTKPIFLILLPSIALAAFLLRKKVRLEPKSILIFLFGLATPVFLWVLTQFRDSDSLLDILGFYASISDQGSIVNLALSNTLRFVTELSPIFVLGVLLIWTASIFFRRFRLSLVETITFLFCIIVCIAYLRTPGWYRYFFQAQVLGLIFLPLALYSIPYIKRFAFPIVALLIILNVYQLGFNSFVAEYYTSHRTEALEGHLNSYSIETTFFVYNVPEIVIFLPSRNYYQYMAPREDQLIGEEQVVKITQGIPDVIVLLTETYGAQIDEFALYKPKDRIDRYTILNRI